MTVGLYTPAVFTLNGVTTVFPYTYEIRTGAAYFTRLNSTTGIETLLVEGVDFTVSAYNNPAGGNVTYAGATAHSGETLTLARATSLTQDLDLTSQLNYDPAQLEPALDKVVMVVQDASVNLSKLQARNAIIDAQIAAATAAAATITTNAAIIVAHTTSIDTVAAHITEVDSAYTNIAAIIAAPAAATSAAASAGTLAAAVATLAGLGFLQDWGFVYETPGTFLDFGTVP